MFISGGLLMALAVLLLAAFGLQTFFRGFGWFGRLPGDFPREGLRARVYAPVTSMLQLSLLFSLVMFLIGALF